MSNTTGGVTPITGVTAAASTSTGNAAIKLSDFIRGINGNIDFSQPDALKQATEILAPLFKAAKDALGNTPEKSMVLAKATHDAYFTDSDKPGIDNSSSYFVDPRALTKANAGQLKNLLTADGQKKVDDYVSGNFLGNGKIFLVPKDILSGKAQDFLKLFGKPNGDAAGLETLISAGDAKKKVFNNQAMSWIELMNRFGVIPQYTAAMSDAGEKLTGLTSLKSETVYSGGNSQEILKIQCGHQFDAVADSSIALAASEIGFVQAQNLGPVYFTLWATHNDWQAKAKQPYAQLDTVERQKDFSIFEAHQQINRTNSNVFAPSIQAVRQVLFSS